jgi:hypothetical protein
MARLARAALLRFHALPSAQATSPAHLATESRMCAEKIRSDDAISLAEQLTMSGTLELVVGIMGSEF